MINILGSLAKLVLSIVVLVAVLVLITGQGLLLGALIGAPLGWAVPFITVPASFFDLAVIITGFVSTTAVLAVAGKLNEKL